MIFGIIRKEWWYVLIMVGINCLQPAFAQSVFEGEWSDAQALSTWFKGDYYTELSLKTRLDTTKPYIGVLDSCVAHRYDGSLPMAEGDVYSFVVGQHFFESEGKRYAWLVVATTDGYACNDCGMTLNISLWEYNPAMPSWEMNFQERDFAIVGSAGIAPQIAFAKIGEIDRIGVFVWQRRSYNHTHHFYLADIFTLIDDHFAPITHSNTQNDAQQPNISNAVNNDPNMPYSYESDFELQTKANLNIFDLNIRKQGTLIQENSITPLDRTYFYHWNAQTQMYNLMDSIDNIRFRTINTTKGATIEQIAAQEGSDIADIMTYNPMLAVVSGGRTDQELPEQTLIFLQNIDKKRQANLQPSFESIEAAVGLPEDEQPPKTEELETPVQTIEQAKTEEIETPPATTERKKAAEIVPEKNTYNSRYTHTVEPKETLFAIASKYKVQISDLQILNNINSDFEIKVGQVLDLGIPKPTENATQKAVLIEKPSNIIPKTPEIVNTTQKKHTVAAGETLFSIGRKYSIALGHLQRINNLKNYTVLIGQELIVSE